MIGAATVSRLTICETNIPFGESHTHTVFVQNPFAALRSDVWTEVRITDFS
jgi:hypothetical protein